MFPFSLRSARASVTAVGHAPMTVKDSITSMSCDHHHQQQQQQQQQHGKWTDKAARHRQTVSPLLRTSVAQYGVTSVRRSDGCVAAYCPVRTASQPLSDPYTSPFVLQYQLTCENNFF